MRNEQLTSRALSCAVLSPCLTAAALVLCAVAENLIWRSGNYYPAALAQVRYVDDVSLLTPQAQRDICNLPLAEPELASKQNGLYLRCGTPGLEGVYKIEDYQDLNTGP